jgi:hypothetical protein
MPVLLYIYLELSWTGRRVGTTGARGAVVGARDAAPAV